MKNLFLTLCWVLGSCALYAQTASISGEVKTLEGELITGVKVELLDGAGNVVAADNNSAYTLGNVPTGQSYSLKISSEGAVLNGVSTFDIVLIHKYVIGLENQFTPYQIASSDVNGSGTVTTHDIVLIRSLILGLNSSFPIGAGWQFLPAGYQFQNPANPFPELENMSNTIQVDGDISDLDFIGLKYGDVNGSVIVE